MAMSRTVMRPEVARAEERYLRNAYYRRVVDEMFHLLEMRSFTPEELREAVALAETLASEMPIPG